MPVSSPPIHALGPGLRRLVLRIAGAGLVGTLAAALVASGSAAAGQAAGQAPATGPAHASATWHRSTLYVATWGNDGWPCSFHRPCLTIQHAVDRADPGSTIKVRTGTYHEQVIIEKKLTLVGDHATIDADGLAAPIEPLASQGIAGYGVLIFGPDSKGTSFSGFTVKNATGEGILAALTSKLSIRKNHLVHNDQGVGTAATVECQDQGDEPGDCGEALHLVAVTWSRVTENVVEHNVGGILLTDELGPTAHNVIGWNVSAWNLEDCGITLPSHNGDALTDPSAAGVYDNWVIGNLSEHNGGAGIGLFAPLPGASAYDNHVINNAVIDNGEAGIAIHAHTSQENLSGNEMIGNVVSGNGVDADSGSPYAHNGIVVFSVDPQDVTVAHNWILHEDAGVYRSGPVTVHGLTTNHFFHVAHHVV